MNGNGPPLKTLDDAQALWRKSMAFHYGFLGEDERVHAEFPAYLLAHGQEACCPIPVLAQYLQEVLGQDPDTYPLRDPHICYCSLQPLRW